MGRGSQARTPTGSPVSYRSNERVARGSGASITTEPQLFLITAIEEWPWAPVSIGRDSLRFLISPTSEWPCVPMTSLLENLASISLQRLRVAGVYQDNIPTSSALYKKVARGSWARISEGSRLFHHREKRVVIPRPALLHNLSYFSIKQ